jgi:hypothetical protein
MTEPTRVGELLPGVLGEVVDRAGHGYQRWAELVAQAGYCHHPIRLAGRVEHADRLTGEVRTVYDSEAELDGVLLKACGTRRESRCHYVFVNHARWDDSLPRFLLRQLTKPSFRTYLLANLQANRTRAMPILYRLASPPLPEARSR